MTTAWYTAAPKDGFGFPLTRGSFIESPDTKCILAEFLLYGLAHEGYVEAVSRQNGLDAAADYLRDRAFADRVSTRIGDFGEIVAGRLLESEEGISRPIEKLRYKDDHNWSMRLTDIFCIGRDSERIVNFVFCEAKAGATPPSEDLAVVAYDRLVQDFETERPEILFMTLEHLWAEGHYKEYEQLNDAMRQREPVPRGMRLVLVFDDSAWSDEVLLKLDEALKEEGATTFDDFRCYLITTGGLRPLIEASYGKAEKKVAAA